MCSMMEKYNNRMRSTQSNSWNTSGLKIQYVPPNRTHHLIKKYHKQNDLADDSKTGTDVSAWHNIFREDGELIDQIGVLQSNRRPAGGIELYKKMEKIQRQSGLKKISKRSNKQGSLSNINPRQSKRTQGQKLSIFNAQIRTIQEQIAQQKQLIVWKDEIYKSHQDYSPSNRRGRCSKGRQTAPVERNSSLSPVTRPQTSKIDDSKQNSLMKENRCVSMHRRAAEQSKSYQDKMALLNEINYNRPLLKTYGNRYFEHTLRNRFQDEVQMGSFVYQLDGQFSESKVIDRIKKHGPLLKQRSYMKLKGHRQITDKTML